jgi:hypothetical protein
VRRFRKTVLSVLLVASSTAMAANTFESIESASDAVVVVNTGAGQGSGVILGSEGTIVTNLHVLDGATNLSVKLKSGEVYDDVSVIDFDAVKDIALLRVKGYDLSTARLGNSNSLRSGQGVYAIGSPRGLEQTVSKGIISAIRTDNGFKQIQTDAAISPGSSGGGLFAENGDLIAVTVSYRADGQNLNFAIPINYVRGMLGQGVRYSEEEFLSLRIFENESAGNGSSASKELISLLEDFQVEFPDLEMAYEDEFVAFAIGENAFVLTEYGDLVLVVSPVLEDIPLNAVDIERTMKTSLEIDYAYLTWSDKNLNMISELHLPSTDVHTLTEVIGSMLLGHDTITENGGLSAVSGTAVLRYPDISYEPPLRSVGLVEVPDTTVTFFYDRTLIEVEAEKVGAPSLQIYNSGSMDYAKVFFEDYESGVDSEKLLDFAIEAFIEQYTEAGPFTGVTELDRGNRYILNNRARWHRWSAEYDGMTLFYTCLVFVDEGTLVTAMFWRLDEEWETSDEHINRVFSGTQLR